MKDNVENYEFIVKNSGFQLIRKVCIVSELISFNDELVLVRYYKYYFYYHGILYELFKVERH